MEGGGGTEKKNIVSFYPPCASKQSRAFVLVGLAALATCHSFTEVQRANFHSHFVLFPVPTSSII